MEFAPRFLRTTLLALLGVLPLGHAYAPARAADFHTISNVAKVQWQAGSGEGTQFSNRVDIRVATSSPQVSSLRTYRLSNTGGQSASLTGAGCLLNGVEIPFQFEGVWAGTSASNVQFEQTTTFRAGAPLILQIDRPMDNRDPGVAEKVTTTIDIAGDREDIRMVETGANTGTFVGAVSTIRNPPAPAHGDCRLSLPSGDRVALDASETAADPAFAEVELSILIDPYGIAFDSADGSQIPGVRITLVEASSGVPARVFGDDGISAYPSTVITGQTVVDAGGTAYTFEPGEYRFPLTYPGNYRLVVEPPAPYAAWSSRTPADLAHLRRPDGQPFTLPAGSYGGDIVLSDPEPVRVDIPLDRPSASLLMTKTASTAIAEAGDVIQYRITLRNGDGARRTGDISITDILSPQLRLRLDTVRLNGEKVGQASDQGGGRILITLPPIDPGATALITYIVEVQPNARAGNALNRAQAADSRGVTSNVADALVRIRRDSIANRMSITGQVFDGACSVDPKSLRGLPGVRLMLEDGSYTVTDQEGRYHFEAVKPGTHVVQLDDHSLPRDRVAVDCSRNTRSGGRAFSRFVEGHGGALKRVDFHLAPSAPRGAEAGKTVERVRPTEDAAAAGAGRDWLAGQEPGIAWLFPEAGHNPRAPVVRVAIKHLPGQSVRLLADGRPVDSTAFEGTIKNGSNKVAASLWRGVPIERLQTMLTAEVRNTDGSLAETLTRRVYFSASPMQATLVPEKSRLVADGITRPVIALRMTDRNGRPVHHGLVGDFEVPAPYYPAVEADAQQARQLAGLERANPVWRVEGDEGIAYVELEPTTASGTVSLRFQFRDGQAAREQRVEAWLDPGDRPWTIVGLAEGTVGFNRLQDGIEDLNEASDDVVTDGRLALYAKGRVSGKWLMTLALDSDKDEKETRFGGVIDPNDYYTVYADRSEQRHDAASMRRLYLKLERPQFYALFGDYETGIDEPRLARYTRAFTGLKAEYRSPQLAATAFAADSPNRHRRDELQGSGLTGPYALGARDILPNSERITIEVRDRLRSDRIVERRLMSRHIDYDIDYRAGVLRFREPILSRSSALDPQFIVADYEVDGVASRSTNAGGRISWRTSDQKLQIAATALRDADDRGNTMLAGADLRYRPSAATEIRAEMAISDTKSDTVADAGGTATAWQIEAEHHGPKFDVLAYAREQESGFGVGQVNAGESGTRKFGIDGRARFTDKLSLAGSAWWENYLAGNARRVAGRMLLEYQGTDLSGRGGLVVADDRLSDGRTAKSTLLQLGATKRFLENRLELDAQTEIPIAHDESVDFPARHRLSARYAVTPDIRLIGTYEIADGENISARTARIGFDLAPWAGARIAVTGNVQDVAEYGPRSFAAFGLSQSLVLDDHWSVDVSLDANKTLGGIEPGRILNPLHPVASGGHLGDGGVLTEDFTAVTTGATYRAGSWSATTRAEYRTGDQGDRYGLTAAALRQIGEGRALGGLFSLFAAEAESGAKTNVTSLLLSWANRPSGSAFSWLDKLELREDRVSGATVGLPGPGGLPFTISGDARSRRVVNSLSINYSPGTTVGDELLDRSEISLFWGSRYVADRFGSDDIEGWSNVLGADLRFDVSSMIDIGGSATLRQGIGARSMAYSGGPNIGIRPFDNGWLSIGWNIVGFHDRDFEEARYTRSGPYATMRLKFDQLSLSSLGLGR